MLLRIKNLSHGEKVGNEFDKFIEKLTGKFQTHLRRLGFIFLFFSVALFLMWALITVFWPVNDARRIRSSISLVDGRELVIDYPKRFLADGQAYPVYVTADALSPLTAELDLPSSLPLVLTDVEPHSAVTLGGTTNNMLILTWPVTSTVVVASPQVTPVITSTGRSLPFEKGPTTITLHFRNAQIRRSFFSCCGWSLASFHLSSQGETYRESILVESIARAHLRFLAENYSFIAILPLLTGGIGLLIKLYGDHKKQQELEGKENLEKFIRQVASTDVHDKKKDELEQRTEFSRESEITKLFDNLKMQSKYLDSERWQLAQRLNAISTGDTSEITASDFEQETDAWAGALIAWFNQFNGTESGIDFYRLARTFPRYKLSSEKLVKFDSMVTPLLRPARSLVWPQPASGVVEQGTNPKIDISGDHTLSKLNLFPNADADASSIKEQHILFARPLEFFLRTHPVYTCVVQSSDHAVIYGEAGAGRTALALALTRYSDPVIPALGRYYHSVPDIASIRRDLIEDLSSVVADQASCLRGLKNQEQRELLANLLVSGRSAPLLLAQLNKSSEDQMLHSQTSSAEFARQQEAVLERRLLSQTIQNVTNGKRSDFSSQDWFCGLDDIVHQMGFKRIVVALDLDVDQWNELLSHSTPYLSKMLEAFGSSVQIIICVASNDEPAASWSRLIKTHKLKSEELTWQPEQLHNMIRYRINKRGMKDELILDWEGGITALSEAAQGNPRRLAQLWQRVETEYPDQDTFTVDMVAAILKKEGLA